MYFLHEYFPKIWVGMDVFGMQSISSPISDNLYNNLLLVSTK
eukprot:SAG11_NODE_3232_length_2595_cov_2.500000_3_plen_42_part_00